MADFLENGVCPLCRETEHRVRYHLSGGYRVVSCAGCDHAYLSPRLVEEEMTRRYASADYFEGGGEGYADSYARQATSLRLTARRFLKRLRAQGLTGGRLLEVGCGYGYFLREAADYFDVVHGTEMSESAARMAREVADAVHVGGVAAIPSGSVYDCIVCFHVVEHVYDPHQFTVNLLARLRPGKALILATPDMGSGWRKWMGSRWPSFIAPAHVSYFDERSLGRLMAHAGASATRRISFPTAFPISLLAEKLGLPGTAFLPSLSVWVPGTTIAMIGTKADASDKGTPF